MSVQPVYEGMARYAEELIRNPTADRQALWQRYVLDAFWEPCTKGGVFVPFAPPLTSAFTDVQALRANIATLRAADIDAQVRAAMKRATPLLPAPATTVCVVAADSSWTYLRDMGGVGGFTPAAGTFWITVLPQPNWSDWITYTVAHEYHHSVWIARHGQADPVADMGDYLVFEGRADAFATRVDPARRAPWTHALSKQQEAGAWKTISRHLEADSAQLLTGLMFGGAEGVPRWSGYTLGFNVVQAFLDSRPELDIAAWTRLDADELLGLSPYAAGLQ